MDSLPFFNIDNDDLLYEFQDLSDLDMLPMLDNIESYKRDSFFEYERKIVN